MRWLKVAAVALGALVVLLVVFSVIGLVLDAVIAVVVIAAVAFGVKVASGRKPVSGKGPDIKVSGPGRDRLPYRLKRPDVDAELARLKREMDR